MWPRFSDVRESINQQYYNILSIISIWNVRNICLWFLAINWFLVLDRVLWMGLIGVSESNWNSIRTISFREGIHSGFGNRHDRYYESLIHLTLCNVILDTWLYVSIRKILIKYGIVLEIYNLRHLSNISCTGCGHIEIPFGKALISKILIVSPWQKASQGGLKEANWGQ